VFLPHRTLSWLIISRYLASYRSGNWGTEALAAWRVWKRCFSPLPCGFMKIVLICLRESESWLGLRIS
jgi:hypothetical protein